MEPHNSQKLLFVSLFFSLFTFNSVQSSCVPRNSFNWIPTPHPTASPNLNPKPKPAPSTTPKHIPNPKPKLASPAFPIIKNLPKAIPGTTNIDPAIKKICNSTDYPQLCISSITPFLNGKTDPVSVVEMAIKASTEQTKLAISLATKLATSPGTTPQLVSSINDCKSSYDDGLDNFQNAMNALPARDVGTMNSMLSAAITDFSDCDDLLSGQNTQLKEFDGKLANMTSICLAIVSLIK